MQASPVTSQPVAASADASRHAWIDHVRTAMIFLVVNMHVCCTYSHVGMWYVQEGADPGFKAKIPFFLWQGHLQAFFMGLLFFLGGHFAHRSLERRGPGAFVRDRSVRLVLPALFYELVVHPFIVVGIDPYGIPSSAKLSWLGRYYGHLEFLGSSGPLWFALALFFFSVGLVMVRGAYRTQAGLRGVPPSGLTLALFGATMVIGTFLIRLIQPIGTNILNFQLCFFPQYVLVFTAGVLSARDDWLTALAAAPKSWKLGLVGLIGGPIFLTTTMILLPPAGDPPSFVGGWNLSAFLMATWEQLTGLALGIGCLALFFRKFNSDGKVGRWLSDHSFGVYVIHAPILVVLTGALAGFHAGLWTKVWVVTAIALALSYAASAILRLVPGLKRIL